MESVSSSSDSAGRRSGDYLAIQADELPRALAEDQNKFIHLDPVPDFRDKAEIKPWLQKIFYPQGIEIVIERSDNIKVIFKCKAAKRGMNTKQQRNSGGGGGATGAAGAAGAGGTADAAKAAKAVQKKKRSVSRFNTCPFRIRATFSLKRRKWNIVVVNNSHSHELKFNPESDEYRKFKEKLRAEQDWEAVKQFDELEYKARSNLPIETSVIPCECGLTSEIESFSIVLPSTRPTQGSTGASPVVSKPKSKRWQQQQQRRHRDKLMRNPSTEHLFPARSSSSSSSSPSAHGCPAALADPGEFAASPGPPGTLALAPDPLEEFNEIDFTDIFKPHTHSHSQPSVLSQGMFQVQPSQGAHSSPPAVTNTPNDTIFSRHDEFSSLLFSPLDAATNGFMNLTDDLLLSPPPQLVPLQLPPQLPLQLPLQSEVTQLHTPLSPHEQQLMLEHNFNDQDLLAPSRLASLWPQQGEEASASPLRRVVNASDSQSPRSDADYPVDDLLWKMNFDNT